MLKIIAWILVAGIIVIILSFTLNMCSDAAKTVQKEYAPSALLKKYEYFKDMSAKIDEKRATIAMYEEEIKDYDKYSSIYQQRRSEMLGIKAMYNSMCADYNAAMAKFNYAFCNKGSLPASNLEPLPREYKPYITK